VFAAFAFGTWLAVKRARTEMVDSGLVMDLVVWILISSLIGARFTYVIFHLNEFQGRWLDTISPIQSDGTVGIAGLVVIGGIVFAVITSIWYLRRKNIPYFKMMDIMVPSLAFGIGLGRVGCYFNGCCFGHPTESIFGIVFPSTCLAGSVYPGQAIHPTQLYALVYSFAIGVALLMRTGSRRFTGELFSLFFVVYGIARFINESLRYYREGMILTKFGESSFTISMFLSIVLMIFGITLYINLNKPIRRRGKR